MKRKTITVIFCVAALIAVLLLASSLQSLRLLPGRSFISSAPAQTPALLPLMEASARTPLWKILVVWAAFVVNVLLFFLLLPPEVRKRIIRQVLSFALGLLALVLALRYRLIQIPGVTSEPAAAAGGAASALIGGEPLPSFQPPQVTPWLAYFVTLAILSALLMLGWIVYKRWLASHPRGGSGLSALAGIAQSSLDGLAAGRRWADVIVECYARMGDTVKEQRGLQRASALTPREFVQVLAEAGLPVESVFRLTRLFESVRYGGRDSSEVQRMEAVACLHSIVQACGATG